jgi:hypothetical protein
MQDTAEGCYLDAEAGCIFLQIPDTELLAIQLPWCINLYECGAQFHRKQRKLMVTMAVDANKFIARDLCDP